MACPSRALSLLAAAALAACGAGWHAPAPASPLHRLSGGTSPGPLRVTRVELAFADGRGEAVVPRGARIAARATVRLAGTGPFLARWSVDGAPVEMVSIVVSSGDTLELETAPATVLPAFEPGRHAVALEILQPAALLPAPSIEYVVTAAGTPSQGARP